MSHKSEMTLTFITNFNNTTYEYYLKQPKSMLEWRLIEKLARNFYLKKTFDRTPSHPLIREYSNVDTLKNEDQNMELMIKQKIPFFISLTREKVEISYKSIQILLSK